MILKIRHSYAEAGTRAGIDQIATEGQVASLAEIILPHKVIRKIVIGQIWGRYIVKLAVGGNRHAIAKERKAGFDGSVDLDVAGSSSEESDFAGGLICKNRATLLGELHADICELFGL